MKWLCCLAGFLCLLIAAPAGFGAEAVSREAVIATVNGRKMTAGQLEDYIAGSPSGSAPDRRQALQQLAFQSTLADMAEELKLSEKSPYREQLASNRGQILAIALINQKATELGEEGADQWMAEIARKSQPTDLNETYFQMPPQDKAAVPPATVIAKVNGAEVTSGEVVALLLAMGPKAQENFRTQPKDFLAQYGRLDLLTKLAEEQKLEQQSPHRERIAWARLQVMSQARMNAYQDSISIGPKAQQDYYEANRDRYTEATLTAIYISFADQPGQKGADGKPVPTEPEAKAKAEGIYQQAVNGTDFVELVHKHSEEKMSREKDGDFGAMSKADPSIPAEVKAAVFAAKKAGEITKPVKLPNGFYIFRIERIGTKSLEDVLQSLMVDAKAAKFQEWITTLQNSLDITYEKPGYFDNN